MSLAFGAAIGLGILANILQFGFLFTLKKITPNFGVLNPLPGIKRLFLSMQTLINLAKQLAKLAVV